MPDGNSTMPPPLAALAMAMQRLIAPASLVEPLPAAPQAVLTLNVVALPLFTVSTVLFLAESVPLVPVTVIVELPEFEDEVETVKVEVAEPLAGTETEDGLKLGVSPAASPLALRPTLPLKLLCDVTVTA